MEQHTPKKKKWDGIYGKAFSREVVASKQLLVGTLYKYRKIDNDSTFAAISHTNNRNEISLKIIQNTK